MGIPALGWRALEIAIQPMVTRRDVRHVRCAPIKIWMFLDLVVVTFL